MMKGMPAGKLLQLLLMVTALLFVSACKTIAADNQAAGMDNSPPISIMAPLHFPTPPSREMMDKLQELTGVQLDINWVPDGIYTDKMNTALTTNSLKKVTFVKNTDYVLMKNTIRAGAFWEIGPYLDRFPNLQRLNKDILMQAAVDGNVYGLYTERPSSRQGAIIRADWMRNLGLELPQTIGELYDMLYAFTYGDPDRNGKADTFGLADRNDLVYGAFKTIGSYFGTPNNWKAEGGTLIPEFETQAYQDTMDFFKKLYDEQLINRDFAVASKDMQRNMLITGKAGVYIGSMTDVQRLYEEAKVINPHAEFTLANRIAGPEGYRVWSIPNYNGLYLFSKKAIKTEDELLRILAFFDRTMDKDVANLMKYGVEGKHYTVVNGAVHLPEETSQLRVEEVNALYTLMIADISNPNVMEVAEKETLTALADRLSEDNDKFLVKDPTVSLESKTYDEQNAELSKIVIDATYNYMLGHLDKQGFKHETERWRESGGNDIIREYTAAYLKR
ncbi:extracellular solute-binding protein [Paenibacillus protaetiae]|uniref:ABC transporter substrate-binding protein n=1 Tax=Paenibacillus protaetiae TaxID=2509456 RepID=A0A4P6EZB7_9BACL|nr:extracellular solute-binding protein [Paenibacillus protaetiae]QAY67633.1 ABC transporter substrate-binding protein [Paenibacillus protaetiae]